MKRFFHILVPLCLISCLDDAEKAQNIVDKSIEIYGCDVINTSTVSFDFRGRRYSGSPHAEGYVYTRTWADSIGTTVDSLFNSNRLVRYTNDSLVSLTKEWEGKYANSVNSVLYFFQLPCRLNDPAVQKKYAGTTTINGARYNQVEVRFSAEDGGEDFEDVYMFWFNQKTSSMDYLAYNYQTEGGGTRFRQAINKRQVGGWTTQDYINYKPQEKFPALTTLPAQLENGELTELSKILNTAVTVD